jgi:hypothetical protein
MNKADSRGPAGGAGRSLAAVAAREYAELFRGAAMRWRQSREADEEHTLCLEAYALDTECGRLMIEALECGYLPAIPGLQELVERHTADDSADRKPGMEARLVGCPSNLFWEVAGGHLLHVRNDNGRWTVVEDPWRGTARHGGLIPGALPVALRKPDRERKALACEFLAKLIEDHTAAATDAGGGNDAESNTGPLTPTERLLLVALRDSRGRLTGPEIRAALEKSGHPVGASTIKTYLPNLMSRGLVDRDPSSKQSGYGLTARGREALNESA